MTDRLAVGVVIPAHDEAATVGAAIDSVRRSLVAARVRSSCIVVVADACTDATAAVARRHLRTRDVVLEVAVRAAGAARAEGCRMVLDRLGPPERTWVLGLDADSRAPRDWVERHLAHAELGVDGVAGVVELESAAPAGLRRALDAHYRVGVTSTSHPHVHGTNLGVRGDALLAAGNWPPLATGEDHALWNALGRLGRRRVQDPGVVVATSARLEGRAPAGFAVDLARLLREEDRSSPTERSSAPGRAGDQPPSLSVSGLTP